MLVCFIIFHANKKIIMPMECSFKSGVLKSKIHMINLVLPGRKKPTGEKYFKKMMTKKTVIHSFFV